MGISLRGRLGRTFQNFEAVCEAAATRVVTVRYDHFRTMSNQKVARVTQPLSGNRIDRIGPVILLLVNMG